MATIDHTYRDRKRETIRFRFEIIGGIVSILALIAGFATIYISLQSLNSTVQSTKAAVDASQSQLVEARYESAYQHQLDLWSLAADKPDVAPYIVGGKKPSEKITEQDKKDAVRAAALSNALDFYAYVFTLAPRDAYDDLPPGVLTGAEKPDWLDQRTWDDWMSWAATIVSGFRGAPGMCDSLNEKDPNGNYPYGEEFRNAVSEAVPDCVK